MKTSVPCPNCQDLLTIKDFEKFPTPFNMKCPHCQTKLIETKMTPLLLLIAVFVVPLLIYLSIIVKSFLTGYFPIVEEVSTVIVFSTLCYPIYLLYEAFNAVVIFNKGNLQLKKRQ